jgi:SAM-dependent MidA family methyltransferase
LSIIQFSFPLRFDRFMEAALHDPDHGYYARRISAVGGTRADFTTAPMLSGAPARAVAARVLAFHRESGIRDVIELGPGEGTLIQQVRASLPWLLRRRIRFHLVESSAALSKRQRANLGTRHFHWHRDPSIALASCRGRAFLFSNELVDAFPVRRFRYRDGDWSESYVLADGDSRSEHFEPTRGLPDSSFFSESPPESTTVEVHASYRHWLADWIDSWTAGQMLTIDYGGPLDHFRRNGPLGTLRAYLLHQRITGPDILSNPGRQDITADVNFDDLIRWGGQLGLETNSLLSLADFLVPHASPSDSQLLSTDGAGSAFQVLLQSRSRSCETSG